MIAPFTQGWKAVFFQTKVEEKEISSVNNNEKDKNKEKDKKKEKPMVIPM